MELCNDVSRFEAVEDQDRAVVREALEAAVVLLAPITPHISHTLWQALGHEQPVVDQPWPVFDDSALVKDTIELVVQVNGKVRAKIDAPASADNATLEEMARTAPNAQRFLEGMTVRKVIVVPGKLVNIVVSA